MRFASGLVMLCGMLLPWLTSACASGPQTKRQARDGAPRWWQQAVVYQIYPRSFQDSDGDGVGDLRGILSRLDYLQELGVDAIWLCPVYPSPGVDQGYDISNYRDIDPRFGTMRDFEALVQGLKARGMRLIMDMVLNHTSDRHPWFEAARQSKRNPYRDYYIWAPPSKSGGPPNDWQSLFGGSAWAKNPATGDYYLHSFAKEQPDLKWSHPPVRQAVYDILRFWRDRGVDGFRLDVVSLYSKPPLEKPMRTDPGRFFANGPKLHAYLQEMHREVLRGRDLLTVGEALGIEESEARDFVAPSRRELDLIFHFEPMLLDREPGNFLRHRPWKLEELKASIARWERAIDDQGHVSVYFGNHDFPRMVSRFGDEGEHRVASAKLLATLLLTLRGVPFLYQGDEIGMTNARFARLSDLRDVQLLSAAEGALAKGESEARFLEQHLAVARDQSRMPMQWDDSANAGFTRGKPWIQVNPNYRNIHVAQQRQDPNSILAYYRTLLRLRRRSPLLLQGRYREVEQGNPKLFVYERSYRGETWRVVLNFSKESQPASAPATPKGGSEGSWSWVLGNVEETKIDASLQPYEARIYRQGAGSSSSTWTSASGEFR